MYDVSCDIITAAAEFFPPTPKKWEGVFSFEWVIVFQPP